MAPWHTHPNAPTPGTLLCKTADIPDGACLELTYGEGATKLRLLAFRDGAAAWVYVNRCPHFSLPLNSRPDTFLIPGHNQIMCAFHCGVFRFEDGVCIDGPPLGLSLEPVPVTVVDGQVILQAA